MDIYLSVNNRAEVFMLPVVPSSFTISKPQTTNTFETVSKGELLLIGEPKLKSITLSSFFPIQGHNYPFLRNRSMWGWDYVNKLDDWIGQKLPIRLTITGTPINMAVAVTNFEYEIRSDGDLWYTLELEEFNLLENGGVAAAETEEELTVGQYEELKQDITNLTAMVSDLANPMGLSMEDFAPRFMTSQLAGVFDVSFEAASGMENDELSNLLRIPMLLKSPETIVEALYWIDDIISRAGEGENKSLLLTQAYEAERLQIPSALEELPAAPNRNTDELAYAYWLGYIYRCECLLHEESSRMVYGAFDEIIMRKAYEELIKSPMGQSDLVDCALDICSELDRLLIEKIWPAKAKDKRRLQDKELERVTKKDEKEVK